MPTRPEVREAVCPRCRRSYGYTVQVDTKTGQIVATGDTGCPSC